MVNTLQTENGPGSLLSTWAIIIYLRLHCSGRVRTPLSYATTTIILILQVARKFGLEIVIIIQIEYDKSTDDLNYSFQSYLSHSHVTSVYPKCYVQAVSLTSAATGNRGFVLF